jgi:hypothetical protein
MTLLMSCNDGPIVLMCKCSGQRREPKGRCPQRMACFEHSCWKRITAFCHGPVGESTHSILKMEDRAARHVGCTCTAQLGGESDDALQRKLRIDRLLRWVWTWFELKVAL